jgi:hypothetical protein
MKNEFWVDLPPLHANYEGLPAQSPVCAIRNGAPFKLNGTDQFDLPDFLKGNRALVEHFQMVAIARGKILAEISQRLDLANHQHQTLANHQYQTLANHQYQDLVNHQHQDLETVASFDFTPVRAPSQTR